MQKMHKIFASTANYCLFCAENAKQKYKMGKNSAIAKKRYSFRAALGQIQNGQLKVVKSRLNDVMGYQNASSWSRCLRGFSPSYGVALEVEKIFREYGVVNCWEEVS